MGGQPLLLVARRTTVSHTTHEQQGPDNGKTGQLGGNNLVADGNKEIIKTEIGPHDSGRMINSGPNNLGTLKEDRIGVRKVGLLGQPIEILVLNINGETSRRQAINIKTGISHLKTNNGRNPHRVVGRIHRVDSHHKQ